MQKKKYYYLVRVSYLGFRYSGWQKQPGVKTIESMLTKTISFVLGETRSFKILGAGRTDAKVSSIHGAFELFIEHEPLKNLDALLDLFNLNLPADIRVESITAVEEKFNIIHSAKEKTYCYLFSFGSKAHPFCAPIMANYPEDLNITLMSRHALEEPRRCDQEEMHTAQVTKRHGHANMLSTTCYFGVRASADQTLDPSAASSSDSLGLGVYFTFF